jgi:hypothetical protein
MRSLRRKLWFIKLSHREYWPVWVYYFPVWIQHFWLALKVKNLFFFLATNPGIEGFILSDSKHKTLELVPPKHRPKSIRTVPGMCTGTISAALGQAGISFPLIAKPDVGFRGIKVHKIGEAAHLEAVLGKYNIPFLLQEYCSYPLELGIFYYRIPGAPKGCIPSITIKEFLTVEGTGKHSLNELVAANPRAALQRNRLKVKFAGIWEQVLPYGQKLELESVGNHNLGTVFHDGSAFADHQLCSIFDTLSHQMEGFYFGRFDIRAESWEALKSEGRYTILEVNGVGGEPTHIYDPAVSLTRAWKDLCESWRIAARIAEKNIANGATKPSYAQARKLWDTYSAYRSSLFM